VFGLCAVFAALSYAQARRAFGKAAEGARRARIERSPQWHGDHFENPQVIINDWTGMFAAIGEASPHGEPSAPLPVVHVDKRALREPPASGLRVTWLGHSSTLIEIDGKRVLTDPSWSERSSPLPWAGPKHWYPPPIALADLPHIDAVLISHDHYDHLDYATMVAMKDWDTRFVVPLGVAAHLVYWGIPESHIAELDWWERTKVGDVEIVCTPSRHQSGRLFPQGQTLWASYALLGPAHRAFFSGDTGLFPGMAEIGRRLGPFDVTLIEVGQYHRTWPDWHIGPEQAVEAQRMLRGQLLLPIHWGQLTLAFHGWTEPIERVLAAAKKAGVAIVAPKPGERVEPASPPPVVRWWPNLAWERAEQSPIVSSQTKPLSTP
jgi:L-ascorbate metabolism protein UlaG (beta-lactamase superfamily)